MAIGQQNSQLDLIKKQIAEANQAGQTNFLDATRAALQNAMTALRGGGNLVGADQFAMQRQQAAMQPIQSTVELMKMEADAGNAQAKGLLDTVGTFASNPDAVSFILQQLEQDPEEVSPANMISKVTRAAALAKEQGIQLGASPKPLSEFGRIQADVQSGMLPAELGQMAFQSKMMQMQPGQLMTGAEIGLTGPDETSKFFVKPGTAPQKIEQSVGQIPGEIAGRVGLGKAFFEKMPQIEEYINRLEKLDALSQGAERAKIISGIGSGGEFNRLVDAGKEAFIRFATGAGLNNQEIEEAKKYVPNATDSIQTMRSKLNQLKNIVENQLQTSMQGRMSQEQINQILSGSDGQIKEVEDMLNRAGIGNQMPPLPMPQQANDELTPEELKELEELRRQFTQ